MNLDRRLIKLLIPSRRPFILSVLLGTASGILTILQAFLLSKVISDVFLKHQNFFDISKEMFLFAMVSLARMGFTWGARIKSEHVAGEIKQRLRERLSDHFRHLGPVHLKTRQSGDLANIWVNGINKLHAYFSAYLPQLFYSLLIPVTVLFFVFPADSLSGFVFVFTAPIIPVFMILIGHAAQALTNRQWKTLSRMSAHFLDILEGLTTLKIFGRSRDKTEDIGRISDQFRKITMKVLKIAFLSALILEMAATLSTAVIAVEIGLRLLYSRIEFQQALFILILAPEFYQPLRLLGSRFHAGMEGISAAQSIFDTLSADHRQKQISGNKKMEVFPEAIRFENVSYTYADSRIPAVKDISFQLEKGGQYALVGSSGSGKSTLAALLCGFITPGSGNILVDQIPLQEYSMSGWRQFVSYIPQHPFLFHRSIEENLWLAKPDASLEEIQEAASRAHLHEFITTLPAGYQTPIGETGSRLSGGQAQRLALARAFLKDAPLLILDEPTASLDFHSEQEITRTINELSQHRTVLIIAHRLTTIEQADNILVLSEGHIVEQGTHRELLLTEGIYKKLISAFRGVKS